MDIISSFEFSNLMDKVNFSNPIFLSNLIAFILLISYAIAEPNLRKKGLKKFFRNLTFSFFALLIIFSLSYTFSDQDDEYKYRKDMNKKYYYIDGESNLFSLDLYPPGINNNAIRFELVKNYYIVHKLVSDVENEYLIFSKNLDSDLCYDQNEKTIMYKDLITLIDDSKEMIEIYNEPSTIKNNLEKNAIILLDEYKILGEYTLYRSTNQYSESLNRVNDYKSQYEQAVNKHFKTSFTDKQIQEIITLAKKFYEEKHPSKKQQ